MPHRRTQIRSAVAVAVTGLASGAPVTIGRVYPWDVPSLPSIDVSTPSEDASEYTMRAGPHARELQVVVECRADGDTYLDTLDQLALEVEQAIGADTSLSGLVDHIKLNATETEQSNEVESPIGVLRLQFMATYSVVAQDPQ